MKVTRDQVLRGALALLEREGLDALTMRRLARALGVQAGAIYWHFADRQALEDAMVDELMADLLSPPPRGRWEDQLRMLMRRMVQAILARRDGARLAVRALRPGPNALALSDAMLGTLRRSGRSERAVLWAASVLGHYVIGFATDVQATEAAKARGLVAITRALVKQLDRARYPELAAFGPRALEDLVSARDLHARFDFGLDVLIEGFKAAAKRGRTTAHRARS